MPDYKSMYFQLAAKVADAVDLLIQAQSDGENTYMQEPPKVTLLKEKTDNAKHQK